MKFIDYRDGGEEFMKKLIACIVIAMLMIGCSDKSLITDKKEGQFSSESKESMWLEEANSFLPYNDLYLEAKNDVRVTLSMKDNLVQNWQCETEDEEVYRMPYRAEGEGQLNNDQVLYNVKEFTYAYINEQGMQEIEYNLKTKVYQYSDGCIINFTDNTANDKCKNTYDFYIYSRVRVLNVVVDQLAQNEDRFFDEYYLYCSDNDPHISFEDSTQYYIGINEILSLYEENLMNFK